MHVPAQSFDLVTRSLLLRPNQHFVSIPDLRTESCMVSLLGSEGQILRPGVHSRTNLKFEFSVHKTPTMHCLVPMGNFKAFYLT